MKPRAHGFTLIEVLVALVVFVAAALALESTMTANVSSQSRFEEKTLATWVAANKLVEMQVYQKWPDSGSQEDEVKFGDRDWAINVAVTAGPYPGTRRVDISVGPKAAGMFAEGRSVTTLTALLVQPQAITPVAGAAP